jgi:hypothetical protein
MSETEQVFALLVEANPVPDPATLPERIADVEPGLHVVDPGRTTMQSEPTTEHTTPEPPRRRMGWIAAAVAAVVVLILGAAAVLLLANDDTQPAVDEPPATTTPPATTVPPEPEAAPVDQARIDTAIAKVEDFYAAINTDDVDAAMALAYADGSFADDPSGEADRNMWEANAVFTASYPYEVQRCESTGTLDDRVVVECTTVNPDPVWVTLGVSDGVVAPWHVFDDGHMEWRALRGEPFSLPNQAYVDYLKLNHLEAYNEVCNPDAYPLGTVNSPQGYSLTRACAELVTPLAEDIAAWIEAGRPE